MADAQHIAGGTGPDVRAVVNGLLWRQWLAFRGLVLGFLAAWLIGAWVLLIFFHPGWILGFGALCGLVLGTALGGGDAAEGSEEFSFALPPTRKTRYLTRLTFGGVVVVLLSGLGLLAIGYDLPQALWGLVVDSGFTEPFEPCRPRCVYGLGFAVPVACYAFTFAIAAAARSRGTAFIAWLWGAAATGGFVLVGLLCEHLLWEEFNGYASVPLLLAVAAAVLLVGYLSYVRKEGITRPAPIAAGGWGWAWVLVVIVALVVLFALSASVRVAQAPARRYEATEAAAEALRDAETKVQDVRTRIAPRSSDPPEEEGEVGVPDSEGSE